MTLIALSLSGCLQKTEIPVPSQVAYEFKLNSKGGLDAQQTYDAIAIIRYFNEAVFELEKFAKKWNKGWL